MDLERVLRVTDNRSHRRVAQLMIRLTVGSRMTEFKSSRIGLASWQVYKANFRQLYWRIHKAHGTIDMRRHCTGVRRISVREELEHVASAVARAYNGSLGAEPAGPRGRAPGEGSGGEAPWSWKLFVVRRPKEVANLAHFWENLTTHLDLQSARVYFRLF